MQRTLIFFLMVIILAFVAGRVAAITLDQLVMVNTSSGEFKFWQEI